MKTKERVCKKCGKKLPEGYKYKQCEACRNVKAEKLGKTMDWAKKAAFPVAGTALMVVTKGKFKLR